jgi:nucleotide-binding universal stress UspA family protein
VLSLCVMIKQLFENLLIVINGSDASIHAVQYAIIMAKQYRCNLKAVYVVDIATIRQLTLQKIFVHDESKEYESSLEADGMRYLRYVEELGKAKGVTIQTELRKGAVWAEVITAANEMKANVILLGGSENNDPFQKEIISSSYGEIILHANCSVLLVREKLIEQLYKIS